MKVLFMFIIQSKLLLLNHFLSLQQSTCHGNDFCLVQVFLVSVVTGRVLAVS